LEVKPEPYNPDAEDNEEVTIKQWHPIFLKSIKESFKDAEPGQIEIIDEVSLSSKPLKVDIIIIQHHPSRKLKNPISQIFRRFNIIEYKSPAKNFAPKDFDMGIAYARMYNVLYNPKEDLLDEYTITYISSKHPSAMFARLRKRGLTIIKDTPIPGIYQLEGEMYAIQIIVINEMEDQEILYPFAAFLTGRDKGEKKAFIRLFEEKLAFPKDENIDHLIEFAVKNDLVDHQEMEEVLRMLSRKSETEKAEYLKIVENSWLGQALKEKAVEMAFNDTNQKTETEKAEYLKMLENSWFGHALLEKGIEKGIEKGMEKSKTAFARKLLLSGMSREYTAEMAELTLEEVEKLQKEMLQETN
jgi:hypothetical protein